MSRTGQVAALAAAALLLSACGAKPQPVTAVQPDTPADLCATVPATAKAGLETSSTTDSLGDPTAACSLRSAPGAKPEVHAVVTWVQLDDYGSADDVLASQCRSIDRTTYTVLPAFSAQGADKACAGSGKLGQADSATMAAVSDRAVVTVRWSSLPRAAEPALVRSKQVLEAVLQSLGSGS